MSTNRSKGTSGSPVLSDSTRTNLIRWAGSISQFVNLVCAFDADTFSVVECNDGFALELGYSAQDLYGVDLIDLAPEFTRSQLADMLSPLVQQPNQVTRFECVLCRKNGSRYPVAGHIAYLAEDSPPVFVASFHGQDSHATAERKLRRMEERLQEAERISHIGNWYLDISTMRLDWSEEIFRILGLDPREFEPTYKTFLAAVHPDDRDRVDRTFWGSVHGKEPYRITHRVVTPEGAVKYVREICETQYSDDGTPLVSLGTVEDITEQYLTTQELNFSNRALRAVTRCNSVLIHASDEDGLYESMCQVIVGDDDYRFVWIGMVHQNGDSIVVPVAHAGFEAGYLSSVQISCEDCELGRGPVGCAARSRRYQLIRNTQTDPAFAPWKAEAAARHYGSVLSLPLLDVSGKVFAVLSIYAEEINAFDNKTVELMERLAEDLAFGVRTLRTRLELDRLRVKQRENEERFNESLVETIRAFSLTVEKRDPYTAGHQAQVADLSVSIGRELGLSEDRIEGIRLGAMIHDIGKIYVPAEILNRPGRLTSAEFEIIQSHAQIGYDILKDIQFPWPVAKMIAQHHERLDGSGYPRGLSSDEIILEAKILAVADVVDAITAHRPYRPAKGLGEAIREIKSNRGVTYDPEVVDACLKVLQGPEF